MGLGRLTRALRCNMVGTYLSIGGGGMQVHKVTPQFGENLLSMIYLDHDGLTRLSLELLGAGAAHYTYMDTLQAVAPRPGSVATLPHSDSPGCAGRVLAVPPRSTVCGLYTKRSDNWLPRGLFSRPRQGIGYHIQESSVDSRVP